MVLSTRFADQLFPLPEHPIYRQVFIYPESHIHKCLHLLLKSTQYLVIYSSLLFINCFLHICLGSSTPGRATLEDRLRFHLETQHVTRRCFWVSLAGFQAPSLGQSAPSDGMHSVYSPPSQQIKKFPFINAGGLGRKRRPDIY